MDVFTSQWFGEEIRKPARSKKGQSVPEVEFLKSKKAEQLVKASNEAAIRKAIEGMPASERKIAERTLRISTEKRPFHWELEFPEVFYGPRPGTERKIERLEGAGFDAVVGNPPYDVLSTQELGYDLSADLTFYRAAAIYSSAIRGKNNLYKLFIVRGLSLMSTSGALSFIVPMPLLGDDQALGVRRHLLQERSLLAIEAFPQKDNPQRRVFTEAKLSTAIFVVSAKRSTGSFSVRTHSGGLIESDSPMLTVSPREVFEFDPANATIPSCSQIDWGLVTRLLKLKSLRRLEQVATSYQGEVNETNERARGTLSKGDTGELVLRGSNICLYAVREASQGEDVRLVVNKFLADKSQDSKAFAHLSDRVGFQRSSPQNNFRRLIAARISKNKFCLDTISYVTDETCQIDLDLLLLFLNSRILEWYFRIGSTNSKVNEYQFNALPILHIEDRIETNSEFAKFLDKTQWELTRASAAHAVEPGTIPRPLTEILIRMSRQIQQIEKRRLLTKRSERSQLAPESQEIQDAADAILFHCYGFTADESRYIDRRLKEMP